MLVQVERVIISLYLSNTQPKYKARNESSWFCISDTVEKH